MNTFINVLAVVGSLAIIAVALLTIFLVKLIVDEIRETREEKRKNAMLYRGRHARSDKSPLEEAKEEVRREKERQARVEAFFLEYYAEAFTKDPKLVSNVKFPTETAEELYKEMDRKRDDITIETATGEL